MSFMRKLATRPKKQPMAGRSATPSTIADTQPFVMRRTGDDSAEIVLYGDIVSKQPTDWHGNPIEGQYIILSDFLEELNRVEDVAHLTVRIHSAGGSAYDAMVIHNRLKALSADITVVVDGVAMSGGSLIMCAGDTVQVYPGSLVMIHTCWQFMFGGYNATELRRIADSNDAVDRSQAAIYQTKTGIAADELMGMMEAETYMTGREAVDKGFADEIVEGSSLEVAASADRRTLFVGSLPVWISTRKDGVPGEINIPTITTETPVVTNTHQPVTAGNQEGGTKAMAKNTAELNPGAIVQMEGGTAVPTIPETPDPSATQAATNIVDPVAAERQRIQEIDQLAGLFDEETVNAAKYGENACTAQEMAYRAAQEASRSGTAFMVAAKEDYQASGAAGVGAAAPATEDPAGEKTPAQRMTEARASVREVLGKKEEK